MFSELETTREHAALAQRYAEVEITLLGVALAPPMDSIRIRCGVAAGAAGTVPATRVVVGGVLVVAPLRVGLPAGSARRCGPGQRVVVQRGFGQRPVARTPRFGVGTRMRPADDDFSMTLRVLL